MHKYRIGQKVTILETPGVVIEQLGHVPNEDPIYRVLIEGERRVFFESELTAIPLPKLLAYRGVHRPHLIGFFELELTEKEMDKQGLERAEKYDMEIQED